MWYRYPQATGNEVPTYFSVPDSARNTPPANLPFWDLDNFVLSPHRAGSAVDTEARRVADLAALLKALASEQGLPNKVDLHRGY